MNARGMQDECLMVIMNYQAGPDGVIMKNSVSIIMV